MKRLLAVALFVSGISLGMKDEVEAELIFPCGSLRNECKRVSVWNDLPAIPGNVNGSIGKNIEVFGPADKVKEFLGISYIHKVYGCNCALVRKWREATKNLGFRWDEAVSDIGSAVFEIKVIGQRCIQENTLEMHRHIFCGGVATIHENGTESPIIIPIPLISLMVLGEGDDIYESPLVGDQGFPGKLGLSVRCVSEDNSKNSDNKGSKSSNNPVMRVQNLGGADEADGGKIFGWGLLVALAVIVAYAIAI